VAPDLLRCKLLALCGVTSGITEEAAPADAGAATDGAEGRQTEQPEVASARQAAVHQVGAGSEIEAMDHDGDQAGDQSGDHERDQGDHAGHAPLPQQQQQLSQQVQQPQPKEGKQLQHQQLATQLQQLQVVDMDHDSGGSLSTSPGSLARCRPPLQQPPSSFPSLLAPDDVAVLLAPRTTARLLPHALQPSSSLSQQQAQSPILLQPLQPKRRSSSGSGAGAAAAAAAVATAAAATSSGSAGDGDEELLRQQLQLLLEQLQGPVEEILANDLDDLWPVRMQFVCCRVGILCGHCQQHTY